MEKMEKTILLDWDLCVGCGACAVACMDQNDIYPEKGEPPYRRIYQVETGTYPNADFRYLSVACRHCEESPCVVGCPTGALAKDRETGSVSVNRDICIGCHSCAMACPFGIPRYDTRDKLYKCTLCAERVKAGLKPACVRVCPMEALKFGIPNTVQGAKEQVYLEKLVNAAQGTGTK
jgi:Fe-S-cluster-containing dehydrogenase component